MDALVEKKPIQRQKVWKAWMNGKGLILVRMECGHDGTVDTSFTLQEIFSIPQRCETCENKGGVTEEAMKEGVALAANYKWTGLVDARVFIKKHLETIGESEPVRLKRRKQRAIYTGFFKYFKSELDKLDDARQEDVGNLILPK